MSGSEVTPTFSKEECAEYLNDMFLRAMSKAPFEVLCTLLRVGGMEDAGWDPFLESEEALDDYNWLLMKCGEERGEKCRWRLGLLMYCQAIEMTSPHELLANFIRCLSGLQYHIKPLGHLGRKKKKELFSWIPPSAKTKFNELKKVSNKVGEKKLCDIIDAFFNDQIRNAFSHSDFVITEEYFRWTESGLAQQISLEDLNRIISNCFSFYSALLWCHKTWLKQMSQSPKYHKWLNYEVLEILSSDDSGVYGFNVHFSNGNKATYSRTNKGTQTTNITFNKEGTINFFVGSLDDLEPVWKIDGKPVKDLDNI